MSGASSSLDALFQALAALPGTPQPEPGPTGRERERRLLLQRALRHAARLPRGPEPQSEDRRLQAARSLRLQAGEALSGLGAHVQVELPQALRRALRRWDQAGELELLPAGSRQAALSLQTTAQTAFEEILGARRRDGALLCLAQAAAEATLAVDSACALLRALEARFVSLLRARIAACGAREPAEQEAALLPGGVPFLDVGAALVAAAAAFLDPAPQATAEPLTEVAAAASPPVEVAA